MTASAMRMGDVDVLVSLELTDAPSAIGPCASTSEMDEQLWLESPNSPLALAASTTLLFAAASGQQYLSKQLAHTPSLSFPDLSLARSTTAQARQAGHILSTPIESDFPWVAICHD